MFKKLDILILRAFIAPFLAALAICIFVLTMQFFWLYIDDLVGKGLDLITILELIGLVSVSTFTTALPLALLFSSIMTFGNLGESFELVAIKAAGIPLTRFMRPLFLFAILLAGLAFLFANNIIPVTQMKLTNLKYEIIIAKPAIDLKEGVFYDKIDGYVIKLGKKEANDSVIKNIVIFEKRFGLQDNYLIAESGVMRVSANKKFLEFIMYNGWRYQERGLRSTTNTEFTRLYFKEYKKVFDLKSFQFNKSNDILYDPKMLSVRQLGKAIDSIANMDSFFVKRTEQELTPYLRFLLYKDSTQLFGKKEFKKPIKKLNQIIPDSIAISVNEAAGYQLSTIDNNFKMLGQIYTENKNAVSIHSIEWHRKFTLSIACLVLFLIGAPLGAIIRKGGLGLPVVFAMLIFISFHFANTFGKKLAEEGGLTPLLGSWMSSLVLTPLAILLNYRATNDIGLINMDIILAPIQQFIKKIVPQK